MAKLANQLLCSESSTVDGIVITHGTDTLEETGFFMDATVQCDKPVVMVGAMRPATAISADGPANLYQAVALAASPSARGRGTLVTLNDKIGSAFWVQKRNGNSIETFGSDMMGYLGAFLSSKPIFFNSPSKPLFKHVFDVSNVTSLPQVDMLISHQEWDAALVPAAISAGAKGIVVAGTGAGGGTSIGDAYVQSAVDSGVPVVFSTKTNNGATPPDGGAGSSSIGAGYLNPVKARLMLQLALGTGMNTSQIAGLFEDKMLALLA